MLKKFFFAALPIQLFLIGIATADTNTTYGKTTCPDGYSVVYTGRIYSSVGGGVTGGNTGDGSVANRVDVTGCLPPSSVPTNMPQAVFDMVCVVCKRD